MNKIVLIDGKNQLFRMHFSPALTPLATGEGFPTGSLFGCLNYSLLAMATRLPDTAFVWVWDGVGETWRHRMMDTLPQVDSDEFPETDEDEGNEDFMSKSFADSMVSTSLDFMGLYKSSKSKSKRPRKPGYKGNRARPEVKASKEKSKYPTDNKARALLQMPVLKLILDGCGIRQYEVPGLECDDLIGILAKRIIEIEEDSKVMILSGDRDFYQLLSWPQVKIAKGIKEGKIEWVTDQDVRNKYGVKPRHWAKYRALTGDSSDNIPHLWKVGKVTAKKMLADGLDPSKSEYDKIPEDIRIKYARYFHPHGIQRMWPAVHGNYKLTKLVTECDDALLSEEVQSKLYDIFRGLKSLDNFCRDEEKKTPASFRKVSFLLSQYELNSILGRRDQLWEIP